MPLDLDAIRNNQDMILRLSMDAHDPAFIELPLFSFDETPLTRDEGLDSFCAYLDREDILYR